MGLNFAAILLAMAGMLNPVFGALVHNAGSVLVILNSAFLLKWQSGNNPVLPKGLRAPEDIAPWPASPLQWIVKISRVMPSA